ncbi:CDP-alcohol phosphatidyltransferase family protein [Pleionea litopenaei]|uniref:CDP-diacylglycerol--glycerol-3-phosphate 3-phosphatidyltransferase n=1 Tax=Pleionea litopenaei TaxID=3070815 RepID=A0AA51RTZ5_9GAMM|nr:CDP-alcohol phosphatidyltransferase family protein [Pleionea sp. HL-JVS1]WMS87540.1 CDP-alcohol phosphatidyltransferase family protein [Pleionea sp. HL-JVS1]
MLRQIPNIITVLRVLLVAPLIYLLAQSQYYWALWLFFFAGLSDGIDGFLAKRFNWKTRFGAILDPLADKLLLVSTMLMLSLNGEISWWLFGLVTLRDLIIVTGAVVYHRALGPYDMQPSRLSKGNTFFQILFVVSVLVSLGWYTLPDWYMLTLEMVVYASTVISGTHYILLWGGRFHRNRDIHSNTKVAKSQSGEQSYPDENNHLKGD